MGVAGQPAQDEFTADAGLRCGFQHVTVAIIQLRKAAGVAPLAPEGMVPLPRREADVVRCDSAAAFNTPRICSAGQI